MRTMIGMLLLVSISELSSAQETVRDVVYLICKMKNIDQVREHVYKDKGFKSQYVVNGKMADFNTFLDAMEDMRSLGSGGAYQDTTGVEVITDGNTGSAMFMSVLHSRIDGDEGKEARVSLMTFWKVGDRWKMLHWHQATMEIED